VGRLKKGSSGRREEGKKKEVARPGEIEGRREKKNEGRLELREVSSSRGASRTSGEFGKERSFPEFGVLRVGFG
jgi:hypothetical protein